MNIIYEVQFVKDGNMHQMFFDSIENVHQSVMLSYEKWDVKPKIMQDTLKFTIPGPRVYRAADGNEIEVYKREVLNKVEHL